jgi:glycosyltransferase involved in cell wall biosynthesis
MKVLWLSNVLFPDVCKEIGVAASVVGGWMYSGARALIAANPEIKLAVATLYSGEKLRCVDNNGITYYLVPNKGGDLQYNCRLELYYKEIVFRLKPDIIHIHGSEYPHSLAYVRSCGGKNVIVSIQGMVSVYANFYLGGISKEEIKRDITFRDIVRRDSILHQQKNMRQRGSYEQELIKSVNHIVGRTSWDKSNVWAINSNSRFHFCNETLRPLFYKHQWAYEGCRKYSIFLSQAYFPIKGIHQLIKALPIILNHFPDTKVYVAGIDFFNVAWYRKNGFVNYLKKLTRKLGVLDKIEFLGELNESEMVKQYLSAHVFVCPSAIENSPNSLGEAQLIGTPCVASYVGGTMDMITDGETGFLYRFEEVPLLAKRVCEIFGNKDLAERISLNERKVASARHDGILNATSINDIYKTIAGENISDL